MTQYGRVLFSCVECPLKLSIVNRTVSRCLGRFKIGHYFLGELVPTVNNNWVKIVWLKKLWEIVFYAVTLLILWGLHERSGCNNFWKLIFWPKMSKLNVSDGLVPHFGCMVLKIQCILNNFKKNPSFHLAFSRKMIFFFIPVNALVKKFCIFPSTEKMLVTLQKKTWKPKYP